MKFKNKLKCNNLKCLELYFDYMFWGIIKLICDVFQGVVTFAAIFILIG